MTHLAVSNPLWLQLKPHIIAATILLVACSWRIRTLKTSWQSVASMQCLSMRIHGQYLCLRCLQHTTCMHECKLQLTEPVNMLTT